MSPERDGFLVPSATERVFNRAFGALLRLGIGRGHNYLLQVRGRKTGRIYSTPVNLLELNGRRWLVAGRGRTQWVRNAEIAGEVGLRRGWRRERCRLRLVPNTEKPEILSAYLSRFTLTVQRYFPVRAGAPRAEFVPFVDRYPVFELLDVTR
jgi:deazaflavin-dependent oxidoreductase (nitroreductase family)